MNLSFSILLLIISIEILFYLRISTIITNQLNLYKNIFRLLKNNDEKNILKCSIDIFKNSFKLLLFFLISLLPLILLLFIFDFKIIKIKEFFFIINNQIIIGISILAYMLLRKIIVKRQLQFFR